MKEEEIIDKYQLLQLQLTQEDCLKIMNMNEE